ncbi:MAG TPA: response regulator transcription factor [Candidatus Nitrosotenuis sp.]|jgi:DNA-binding NarL/FixJ family response regulator|nr:response regulator transcription factor [Candidatus Nitrosotenuis sp.]
MGIRVMIVDDHEVVRAGLQTVLDLEEDIEVVGQAASGEEALARLKSTPADVVLMDVVMPGMGGVVACREIRDRWPEVRVVMLTSFADDEAVMSSLVAGAAGYLLKNVGRADLARTIRLVAEGQKMLDPAITEKVTRKLVEAVAGSKGPVGPLSEREQQIVRLVARGYTNRQIAEHLVIAEKTARNHVSRILEKLNLSRRSEAAAWAARQGLVEPE